MMSGYVCFVLGAEADPLAFACVGGSPCGLFEVFGGRMVDCETDAQKLDRYRELETLSDWFNYGTGPLPPGWRRASSVEDARIRSCLRDTVGAVYV